MLVLWALSVPATAVARPATRVLDLTVGREQFLKPAVGAPVVDRPEFVSVEAFASGEVLLTPKVPGRALLFLVRPGAIETVRLRVRGEGAAPPEVRTGAAEREAARKACPRLALEERALEATVTSPACRKALATLLEADDWLEGAVRIYFTEETLADQLAALRVELGRRGLAPRVELAYVGAALRLRAQVSRAELGPLLETLFAGSVGRLLLDDKSSLEVEPSPTEPPVPPPSPPGSPPPAGPVPPAAGRDAPSTPSPQAAPASPSPEGREKRRSDGQAGKRAR